jgi:DNA modification methylase
MSAKNKIIVLGKEFNSEEERRTYFREELRKKLPELKLMEGFPIGEDEDILNLSDPPYYTACPNPWLNDFIAEWEEEKKELEKKGLRKADFEVTEPYAADVSEGKNNPIYNAHSYHTKVPHPAIMRYILHYTQPGDIVFDGFAGTGMTGVAAQNCSEPDPETKYSFESSSSKHGYKMPTWGKRNTILSDLSPVATFISSNYNTPVLLEEFLAYTNEILEDFEKEYGWLYETKHEETKKGKINYIVWSDVFGCPFCMHEFIFYNIAVDETTGAVKKEFDCPNCKSQLSKRNSIKIKETKTDLLPDRTQSIQKITPVLINYVYRNKVYSKKPDQDDLKLIDKIEKEQPKYWFPSFEIPKGDKMGDPLSKGFTHIHHFYTKRALLALSKLYHLGFKRAKKGQSHALFLIEQLTLGMSKIARYVPTHYSQVNQYLSGTLYVGSQVVDVSPMYILKGKISRLPKAFKLIKNRQVNSLQSATDISQLNYNSVDYIFTDPPFGANLMYSELNMLWEAWLKIRTNSKEEAIENKTQKKNVLAYQVLMSTCYVQYYNVLKPGAWMTVEFSNTNAAIWNGIQTAIQQAGFIVANVAALDKKQGSFNAVSNPTSVKQDLVISCYKPSSEFDQKFNQHKHSDVGVWEFVAEHLEHLPIHLISGNSTTAIIERSPKILFDRLIAFYIQRGLPVPIDAGKFQQGLRERFIERDGMFFTNEQVQEYDRKKAETPNFLQLSMFVANEQDAIYWLRHILEKESKTEQDLHPLWMKEVAGNMRKGDTLPEMRTILEENFLKNDKGQWYLPDPENEADLEKLRTKRLLKQFETYKTEAYKPKGKIKEARVEALRAGFKQCYQDKDFKSIVQIGDRIPNNLLMEDEVLLQFYDIASSRV